MPEHVSQASHELGIADKHIYNALRVLERKGFIARKRLGPGKGFSITFQNSEGRKTVSRSEKIVGKLDKLLSILQRVAVGDELVFAAEHAREMGRELGSRDTDVYGMLKRLEKRKFIVRKKLERGNGFLVTIRTASSQKSKDAHVSPKETQKNGSSKSVADVLRELEREIALDEMALNFKKDFYATLKARAEGRSL